MGSPQGHGVAILRMDHFGVVVDDIGEVVGRTRAPGAELAGEVAE